jgi:hypothetical protein
MFREVIWAGKKVAIRDNSLSSDKSLSLTSPEGVGRSDYYALVNLHVL